MGAIGLGLRLGGQRGRAFSPASLFAGGEAGAWYDPSDLGSLFQDGAGTVPAAVGQPVARMLDRSGRGNHLVQTVAASRPVLREESGRFFLEFDGVDDWLDGGDVLDLGTGGYFGVAAARLGGAASQGIFGKSIAGASNSRYAMLFTSGAMHSLLQPTNMGSSTASKNAPYAPGSTDVLTAQVSRSAGSNRLRVNGVTKVPDVTFPPDGGTWQSSYRFRVGAYANSTDTGPQMFLGGRIYGLLVRTGGFTDVDVTRVERWMARKAGVAIA